MDQAELIRWLRRQEAEYCQAAADEIERLGYQLKRAAGALEGLSKSITIERLKDARLSYAGVPLEEDREAEIRALLRVPKSAWPSEEPHRAVVELLDTIDIMRRYASAERGGK